MEKSIYSKDYAVFLSLLRDARKDAGITQGTLAERLGCTQSFVSKCERAERRLDLVELRSFCKALGLDFQEFVGRVHTTLGGDRRRAR